MLRATEYFIVDVLIAIDKINRKIERAKSIEVFISDEDMFDSAMRDLEIIGEAAKHILKDEKFAKNAKIDWRRVVDFRNIVVHEYFGIDLGIVVDVIKNKIPMLKKDLMDACLRFGNKEVLLDAISGAKQEMLKMNRQDAVDFLCNLELLLK